MRSIWAEGGRRTGMQFNTKPAQCMRPRNTERVQQCNCKNIFYCDRKSPRRSGSSDRRWHRHRQTCGKLIRFCLGGDGGWRRWRWWGVAPAVSRNAATCLIWFGASGAGHLWPGSNSANSINCATFETTQKTGHFAAASREKHIHTFYPGYFWSLCTSPLLPPPPSVSHVTSHQCVCVCWFFV